MSHMQWVSHQGKPLSSDCNADKAFPTPTDAIMHHILKVPIRAEIKMKISLKALEKRMSRALLKNGTKLRRCSERSASFNDLGYWYGVNVENNAIEFSKWDITNLVNNAREMGIMQPHESLAA